MTVATVYGMQGLSNWARTQDLAAQGTDFSPALRQCLVAIRGDALENFQSSAGPDGTAWPALHAMTVGARRQGSSRPLQDRGILAGSISGRGADSYEHLTPTSLEMGTNVIYARLMQEGGIVKPVKAKSLAVPLTPKARRIGSPRQWKESRLFRPKGHNVLGISAGKGRNAHFEGQYVLLAQVRIPARPYLGFGDRLARKIDDIIGDFVERESDRHMLG